MEDDHKKQAGLEVKDPATALDFLMEGDFKSEEDDMSFKLLSIILMQFSQQSRALKFASEAFKAISYIILELHQKRNIEETTDIIAKAISITTKRIRDELVEATNQLVLVVAETNNAGNQLKKDCQEVISNLKGTLEKAILLQMEDRIHKDREPEGEERLESKMAWGLDTYANRAKKCIPSGHITAVVRAKSQKRKIRLIKAPGMVGIGLS